MNMKYSISKAFIMMVSNIKIYIWIVIELMLIISILVLTDAMNRSANSEINQLNDIYKSQEIYISYYIIDAALSSESLVECGITFSDYIMLQDEVSQNTKLQYYICDHIDLYHEGIFETIYIMWGTDDFSKAQDEINNIISILLNQYGSQFNYSYNDVLSNYIGYVDDILKDVDLFAFFAKICLCISVFGITGIMIILVKKRKKEYAISYAMGERKLNIYTELLFEVFGVSSAGCILGCIVGFLLTKLDIQSTFQVQFYLSCVFVPFLVSLMIPFLTSVIIIPDVDAKNPIETLKSE